MATGEAAEQRGTGAEASWIPEGSNGTLLLHTGGAKTGTSALQNLLRAGVERLAEAGVSYAGVAPMTDPTEITSGNAPPLTRALKAGRADEVRSLLRLFMGGRRLGLASFETLEGLTEPDWRLLLAMAGEEGLALRVVHVVRDPLPLLLSVYDQRVKRHGEARPVAEWAATHALRVFDHLRLLDRLAGEGALALSVLRYDTIRTALGESVLRALGLDPRLLAELSIGEVPVNRSLDAAERRILRRVNATFGDRHSKALSDRLLAAHPARPVEPPHNPALAALLRRRHGADVAWTNATFFPGGGGLVLPEEDAAETGADPAREDLGGSDAPEAPDPGAVALDWAIEALARVAPDDAAGVLRHLLAVLRMPRPADPRLPEDFDPLAYLVLNPRLVGKRVNPYAHWIAHGARLGLRYRP